MTFTQLPDDYASLYAPLVYRFETGAAPADLEVRIIDPRTETLLATKRLFDTDRGSVDIARILRSRIAFRPATGLTGCIDASERLAVAVVEIDGVRSPERRFVAAAEPLPPVGVAATALPRRRLLVRGECDEITFRADAATSVSVIPEGGGLIPLFYRPLSPDLGIFRLNTDRQFVGAETVVVEIQQNDTVTDRFDYTILPSDTSGGTRIAWRSAAGSVEHYTFPVEYECRTEVERTRISTAGEGLRTVAATALRHRTLLSAFEPRAVAEALSGVIEAPQVWVAASDGYRPVDVLDTSEIIRRNATLHQLELHLRDAHKSPRL